MQTNSIPQFSMGKVSLNVKNLSNMTKFYSNGIGLDILYSDDNKTILGLQNTEIINLIKRVDLMFPQFHSAGLYHTAILFQNKEMLAKSLMNMFEIYSDLFEGSGDHLVSQAFYFHDPEGNGLELYVDRPQNEWKWENGQVVMSTIYIDPEKFINENFGLNDGNLVAKTGHVHLKVGEIQKAKEFYVGILGFDITAILPNDNPSAMFISFNGYHHHLGLNTWESYGAQKRKESLGLASVELNFGSKFKLENLIFKLQENKAFFNIKDKVISILDPWENKIIVSAE